MFDDLVRALRMFFVDSGIAAALAEFGRTFVLEFVRDRLPDMFGWVTNNLGDVVSWLQDIFLGD